MRGREGGRGEEAEGEDVGFGEGVEEDGGAAGGEEHDAGEGDVGGLLKVGGREIKKVCLTSETYEEWKEKGRA